MEKLIILHRDELIVESIEYEIDEELEEIYNDYDDSPLICGTLFLTEEEFKALKGFELK